MLCLVLAAPQQAGSSREAPERTPGGRMLLPGLVLCGLALVISVTRAGVGAVLIAVALALLLYRQVRLLFVTLVGCIGIFVLFEDYLFKMTYSTFTMNDASTV